MTDYQVDPPKTEAEWRESNARITRALRWSPVFYTPFVALLLWVTNVPYWAGVTAVFILIELVSYPVLKRSVDRNTERQIEAMRAEQNTF
jgi:hypothetical protein